MHFGRVEKLSEFDPTLPPDSARTEKFLALPRHGTTRLYVGCPIWSSTAWIGDLYPKGTKASGFLRLYAETFNTVELNSSFYHLPDPERVAQWRDETPPHFRFCPKVFRGITEDLGSPHLPDLIARFTEAVAQFQSRLGLTFAQFSDAFGPARQPLLERFLSLWPEEIPLAVELRHPGWFHDRALPDEIVNLFYRRNTASLITDTAGRRDVLHLSLTQPRVMIRFQGNEGHPMDDARLAEWAKRVNKWRERSLEEIYFFTHQPSDVLIPETARVALRQMTGSAPERLPPPPQQGQLELL